MQMLLLGAVHGAQHSAKFFRCEHSTVAEHDRGCVSVPNPSTSVSAGPEHNELLHDSPDVAASRLVPRRVQLHPEVVF